MGCPAAMPDAYLPRRPGKTVLHEPVAGHLETFLARQRECDRPVPRFVERELRESLGCGVAAGAWPTRQLTWRPRVSR